MQAAASAGNNGSINLLLENKPPALVNTPGGHYGSALRAAVHSGDSDTVWTLLEENANPNLDIRGGPLLDEAASMGSSHRDIVSDLITAQSKVDLSPKGDGVHIMHRAAMYGMTELIEYCIKENCRIDMVTTQGPKYHRKFSMYFSKFSFSFPGNMRNTSLLGTQAWKGQANSIVSADDFPDEISPLGFACAEGHLGIVELLLDNNAPFEETKIYSAYVDFEFLIAPFTRYKTIAPAITTRLAIYLNSTFDALCQKGLY